MNLNHFYHYYKSKSGGVSNLLKATEDFDSSLDWLKKPDTDAPTITGGVTDPNGGTDAQRINFTANRQSRVQQSVTLSASTQYTFSVYARVNTGTDQFRLRNITLGAAQPSTATTSWTRFEYTFTTTTGGVYELSIQNTENLVANIEFFGAMLNVGSSANDYVKVDPSTGGSAPTPAYSGFGDVFGGATAYYSLRQFTEAETLNAIRVRRSSDDTEQDIGFDSNGDLDSTALLAFVGTGGTDNGFVTTWYDQSGNGNDATNSTASEQPLVVSGGTLVTENGKAALDFDGVDDNLQNTSLVSSTPTTHYLTAKANRTGVLQRFFDGGVSNSTRHSIFQNASQFQYFAGGTITGTSEDTNQNLHYFLANGTSSEIGINGATASTGDAGTDTLNGLTFAARWDGGANFGDVLIQELIIFNSDQSGNRGTVTTGGGTLIEGNINTYFNIV